MNHLITLAACLTVTVLLQSQTIIRVSPTGTGDGTSWQNAGNLEEAIRSLNGVETAGIEIWVQGGTYQPSEMLTVPDSVKVYGGFSGTETMLSQRLVAANPTIVDGQQKIGSVFRLENSAEINGFTIQNGRANGRSQKSGGGVWADENCVIANCIITNNTALLNGGGIYAKGKVRIINCIVEHNVANGNGNNLFGNCVVLGNEQSDMASGVEIAGCNKGIPDFGEINFKSENTWIIPISDGSQEWSDVVMASACNKTWFNGGNSGNYSSDCRANTDRSSHGDLFSWCAVARFAHVLCPAPWRVPTAEDFFNLDKALGGNGDGSGPSTNAAPGTSTAGKYYYNYAICNNYISTWGDLYRGFCVGDGTLVYYGAFSEFWMLSEHSAEYGYYSERGTNGIIRPQGSTGKETGFSLRCIR